MNVKSGLFGIVAGMLLVAGPIHAVDHFARFTLNGSEHYGRVDGDNLLLLSGGLFPMSALTGKSTKLSDVKLLPPTKPTKVFAVGKNFASHRSSNPKKPPPLFLKLPSALIGHGSAVVLPEDARNVHFEGELVLVIGRSASNISEAQAADFVFGVTVGNDITERSWQRSDLQWLRAKATDGFGPVGPYIAKGLNYSDVMLTTTLNGKVVQQESTKNMIHSPAKVVSYLSRYFTLTPGDLIFMGTPGKTRAMAADDVISVEIEGIGVLTNSISQR